MAVQSLMVVNSIYFFYLAFFTLPIFSLTSFLDGKELRWHLLPPELQAALQEPDEEVRHGLVAQSPVVFFSHLLV